MFLLITVGEFKDDRFQTHQHYATSDSDIAAIPYCPGSGNLGFQTSTSYSTKISGYLGKVGNPVGTKLRIGTTTRTKSKGVKYIIKVI